MVGKQNNAPRAMHRTCRRGRDILTGSQWCPAFLLAKSGNLHLEDMGGRAAGTLRGNLPRSVLSGL